MTWDWTMKQDSAKRRHTILWDPIRPPKRVAVCSLKRRCTLLVSQPLFPTVRTTTGHVSTWRSLFRARSRTYISAGTPSSTTQVKTDATETTWVTKTVRYSPSWKGESGHTCQIGADWEYDKNTVLEMGLDNTVSLPMPTTMPRTRRSGGRIA